MWNVLEWGIRPLTYSISICISGYAELHTSLPWLTWRVPSFFLSICTQKLISMIGGACWCVYVCKCTYVYPFHLFPEEYFLDSFMKFSSKIWCFIWKHSRELEVLFPCLLQSLLLAGWAVNMSKDQKLILGVAVEMLKASFCSLFFLL